MADANPASERNDAGRGVSAPASNNLVLRIVSAAVLVPLALAAVYLGDWPFALFWGVAGVAVVWEWITLVSGSGSRLIFSACAAAISAAAAGAWLGSPIAAIMLVGLGAFAAAIFAPRARRLWISSGVLYAGAMLLTPMLLRQDPDYGETAMFFLFAVVWTTDVLAYAAGRALGGPKLAPAISPKKTWVGAIAGALGAVAVSVAGTAFLHISNRAAIAPMALLLSVAAQLGDLMESRIKRRFDAKDTSGLIPGHGGIMDRLDGFWAAALIGCLIGVARGGFDGAASGLLLW